MSEIKIENVYYLGPDGSNAHNAMLRFLDKSGIEYKNTAAQKSIKTALDFLEKDFSSLCVIPIENSIVGIVRETIDNLLSINDNRVQIQGEITLPINHLLLTKTTDISKIKKIISHRQALAQCSRFIEENFKEVELKEVASTSYAAQKIASIDDDTVAAIANETCAKLHDLNILASNINDEKDNKTRFYILGRERISNDLTGKTALILSTKNHPGALCDVLQILSKHDINLSYIDSRPSKKKLGEYLFFMELDGLKEDYRVKMALEELISYVDFLKILGSFKIYD